VNAPFAAPLLRVLRHDKAQLEIKLEYPSLGATEPEVSYAVDLWFFLPPSAGVTQENYGPERFYEDLRAHTRLRTPRAPLRELCRPDGQGSPLGVLRHLLAELGSGPPAPEPARELRREARLLCCIYKESAREPFLALAAGAAAGPVVERFVEDNQRLLEHWRSLARAVLARPVDARTRECFQFVDEGLSLMVESTALQLLDTLGPGPRPAAAEGLAALARAEAAHRAEAGHRSAAGPGAAGRALEAYLDQASLLKKYISAVLFLDARPRGDTRLLEQLALGLAAAVAMVFTIGLQLIALLFWDIELTRGVPPGMIVLFSAITVVGYVIKDRLKALLGPSLARRIPRLLYDRRTDFERMNLPDRVSEVRETTRFVGRWELPPAVQAQRVATARSPLALETDGAVLHHHRTLTVFPKAAARTFPRIEGVVEILRLHTWRWVRTFGSPNKDLVLLDGDDAAVHHKAPNLYFVDLVIGWRRIGPSPAAQTEVHRIVLDRRGIVEVRPVSAWGDGPAADV
jgi:hypothetical protein